MFDKSTFLNQETDAQGSTQYTPVPDDEYPAVVEKVDYVEVQTKDGLSPQLLVFWNAQAPQLEAITGLKKNVIRQSLWLDLTANGGLDMAKGRNVPLNRLREALGQNVAGALWKPTTLIGRPGKIKTKTRVVHDDTTGQDKFYTDVAAVTGL